MNKSLLLTICVMMTGISSFARDFSYTYEGQNITYAVIDEDAKTCMVKIGCSEDGNKVSGDLILPSNPKDGNTKFNLIEIGEQAFNWCTGLTSIVIPNSVQTIGYRAFYNCSGLPSIVIPNSVSTIGNGAFAYCSGLTSVDIPNSVKTIG